MRSDWDAEHAARKGRNQHGEKRLAQFTDSELRVMAAALRNHEPGPYTESTRLKALRKVEERIAAREAAAEPADEQDGAPCCPDPGCPGRNGTRPCEFPGYADNH